MGWVDASGTAAAATVPALAVADATSLYSRAVN
jgi:hypothetical protein